MGSDDFDAIVTVEDYQRTLEDIERVEADLQLRMARLETLKTIARAKRDFLVQAGRLTSGHAGADTGESYPRGMDGMLLVLLDFFPRQVDTREILERAQVFDAVDSGSRHGSSIVGTTLRRLAARGLAVKDGRRWRLTEAGHRAATALLEEEVAT